MASKFRQDMPPQGGYGPIQWARTIQKRRFGGYASLGIFAAITGFGYMLWRWEYIVRKRNNLEMQDGRLAIEPLLLAERHRLYLHRLRQNRDEETELMKDVPGWETGTLYGHPVHHNLPNKFPPIPLEEYYAHSKYRDFYRRTFENKHH